MTFIIHCKDCGKRFQQSHSTEDRCIGCRNKQLECWAADYRTRITDLEWDRKMTSLGFRDKR